MILGAKPAERFRATRDFQHGRGFLYQLNKKLDSPKARPSQRDRTGGNLAVISLGKSNAMLRDLRFLPEGRIQFLEKVNGHRGQ